MLRFKDFMKNLDFTGFNNIRAAIEKHNSINPMENAEKESYTLFHGSKLIDKINAECMNAAFPTCVSMYMHYGVVYCVLDIEGFLQLEGVEVENLDYQLWSIEKTRRVAFMDFSKMYSNAEFELVKETLEALDIYECDDDFCYAANWILDNPECIIYTDFIDFNDSDLFAYLESRHEDQAV